MKNLRELHLRSVRLDDEDWKYLGELTALESLQIDYARFVTDKGLGHLRRLTNLRSLRLGQIEHITDKSLEHIKGLNKLQNLRLGRLAVTDAGLQQLQGLTDLQTLDLSSLRITDKGLQILKGLTKLRVLRLWGIEGISDETLKALTGLTILRELSISNVGIGDAGLVYLKELPQIEILILSATPITNRGLGHLKAMHSLRTIDVGNCFEVTDAGVESFRAARPGTKVIQFTAKQTGYFPTWNDGAAESKSRGLAPLVRVLAESDDDAVQFDVSEGMHEALQGRRKVTAPEGWSKVYRKLSNSENGEVREKVLQLSVLFGDPQALAALCKTAADTKADASRRRNALQTLVEKRPPDLLPLLRSLLTDRAFAARPCAAWLRTAIRRRRPLILEHYASLTDAEKADAIATLASRPAFALSLLDAMEKGRVPRRDMSAFTVRQLLAFNNKKLTDRLSKVWGSIRPPSAEKATLLPKYKAMVPTDALKKADRKHGRSLFAKTCARLVTRYSTTAAKSDPT